MEITDMAKTDETRDEQAFWSYAAGPACGVYELDWTAPHGGSKLIVAASFFANTYKPKRGDYQFSYWRPVETTEPYALSRDFKGRNGQYLTPAVGIGDIMAVKDGNGALSVYRLVPGGIVPEYEFGLDAA